MLALSGERQHGLFLIRVKGRDVWLQERLFLALCQLAHARKHTVTGYVRIDRRLISLLRAAINEQTGREGLGGQLIQTGNYRDYRLCEEAKDFVTEPSFAELPADLIDPELKEGVRSEYRIGTPSKP
jgi:hypothetical protein